MDLELYWRDSVGPICYATRLFDNERYARVLETLLSYPITWKWFSLRRHPDEDHLSSNPTLPDIRALTTLSPETKSVFVADICEYEADGYGRGFAVFGLDPGAAEVCTDSTLFRTSLFEFIQREAGPIRAVITYDGDSRVDLVFVPHMPIPPVEDLLEKLGLKKELAKRMRRYRSILESQVDVILRYAFK